MSNLDNVLKEYDLHSTEGARGLKNLAKLVHLLGFKDFQFYGQYENGAAAGDILTFLESNSGAIEVLYDFISENYDDELAELVDEEEEEDEEESSEDIPWHKESYVAFHKDMLKAGLKVNHYRGRNFYDGPAVDVDNIQDALCLTKVPCVWDNMGKGFVVYPK